MKKGRNQEEYHNSMKKNKLPNKKEQKKLSKRLRKQSRNSGNKWVSVTSSRNSKNWRESKRRTR